LAKYSFGEYVGPTQPKKPYWGNTFSENVEKYFKLNKKYRLNNSEFPIQELEKMNFVLYYDGSSYFAGDQSGGDRFANGRKFAAENYKEIIHGLGGEAIYFVSHSEGGAYAAGMADYLYSKGHKIGEHVLLSPDEGDEFEINPKIPSYQLTYMFFSSVYNPIMADVKYFKFKRWGSYYAIVDEIVNEHRIKGVTKMGIVRRDDLDWSSVHGSTNSSRIFTRVNDLKEVKSFDVRVEYEKEFYSGKDQTKTKSGTIFYRINDDYIITNCPPISKIK
jgi:hypothetical protein